MAEDHLTLREGLRMLLELEGDISVLTEVEGGQEAVAKALALRPNVVLMDIALVGLDGIEATRRLHAQAPEIAVLILSANPELHVVRATLNAGATGYLLKRASGKELREAVRAAGQGVPFFSAEVMGAVRERARVGPSRAENPASLTGRETEILQLIAGGYSNREIGEALSISIKTVDTHRMHIMAKLDIHDVAGLTRYAIRKGLIE
ncbi:MAG TPA: response regulator transcription factor [Haliangiales bacterium]|nr:response regulator transcription factor [Haliangiales bacterium]